MRLCFIASANSIHAKKWITYFTQGGHEVHWISLTLPTEEIDKNIILYQMGMLATAFSVRRLIRQIKPDVLHAHYVGMNGLLGALSGFHPFIVTAWGSDILVAGRSVWKKPLIRWILKKADLITCDAYHMKEAIEKFNVLSEKIKLVYFGVDTQKFSLGIRDSELVSRLNLGTAPVVISLRNFEPVYNLETLVQAMPLIIKSIPAVIFLLGGAGSEEQKLRNMVDELGVKEHVRFLGWVTNDYLPLYLRLARVYVSTSLSDGGIASSTAEAMACGVPVVVTNFGENEKWISDGENGFLVPIKAPALLADRVVRLLCDEKLGRLLGERGRTVILERNDYNKEMNRMEKLYEKSFDYN